VPNDAQPPARYRVLDEGLPANLEAERWVLQCCFWANEIPKEAQALSPADFMLSKHKTVFLAMLAVSAAGAPVEYLGVVDQLETQGRLEQAGGISTVGGLTGEQIPDPENIGHYVELIREKARLRHIVDVSHKAICDAANQSYPSVEIIAEATARLEKCRSGSPEVARELDLTHALARYEEHARDIDTALFKIGLGVIDEKLGGLARGEVLTLLAGPGVGKTSWLLNALLRTLYRNPAAGAALASLEMPEVQITERLLQIAAGIGRDRAIFMARHGWQTTGEDADSVTQGLEALRTVGPRLSIWSRSAGVKDLARFVEGVRAAGRRVDVVGVDYLQLMRADGRSSSLYEQFTPIARGMKDLAKDLDVAVILLSQINRDANGGWQRVLKKHGRDSGAIEEACDHQIGIWRPELDPDLGTDERLQLRGQVHGTILKNRRGPAPVDIDMHFHGPTQRFMEGV